MLSRALILATVTFLLGCFGTTLAVAQNLEAGKPPSQIFSSTCSLCHKGARGLLKSVAPGSLPGFLRQHYTTSSDMAAAMSAYVLSNGAANAPVAGGNLTKQGQEARSAPKPSATPDGRSDPRQEQAAREAAKGRKPPQREASRPDAEGQQDGAASSAPEAAPLTARQKAAAERRAARQAARDKAAGKGEPAPKIDARHESSPKDDAATAAKTDAPKTEPSAPEAGKTETAKVDGTRADPVPAVTPAPKEEKPASAAVAALPPKDDAPAGPLTIDIGPAKTPVAAVVAPSGPPPVRAGNPVPPISR